jgi:hypothetical protein
MGRWSARIDAPPPVASSINNYASPLADLPPSRRRIAQARRDSQRTLTDVEG